MKINFTRVNDVIIDNFINIPEGHAILNFGKSLKDDGSIKFWLFVIKYSQEKYESGSYVDSSVLGDSKHYDVGIRLTNYKQAYTYADIFNEMGKIMEQCQIAEITEE